MNKKIFYNYFYQSSYKLLTMILPIITIPIVSKAIGPEGIGLWNYVNSIVTYFVLVAGLGLSTYGVREIAKSRSDSEKLSTIFWELQIFNMVFSGTTFIIYILFSLTQEYSVFFLIQSLILLSVFFDISWFFIGIEDFKKVTLANYIVKIISFIIIVLFIKSESDLLLYFFVQSLTLLVPQFIFWVLIFKRVKRVNIKKLKPFSHFSAAVVFLIPRLSTTLNISMSKTILGVFATIQMVGYYSNSLSLVILSGSLIMAVNDVMLPRLSNLASNGDEKKFFSLFSKSVHIQLFLSIPTVFGIIVITPTLVSWFFGEEFLYLIKIIPLLAPILITQTLQSSLGNQFFIPKNLVKYYNGYTLIGACISLFLNILLVKIIGIYAVIIGVSLGYFVMCLIMSRYLYKNTMFRYNYVQILKCIIASLVMYLSVRFFTAGYSGTIKSTIIQVILGILIYFVIVTIIDGNPMIERKKLFEKIKKKFLLYL